MSGVEVGLLLMLVVAVVLLVEQHITCAELRAQRDALQDQIDAMIESKRRK